MKVAVYCRVGTRAQCDQPGEKAQRQLGEERAKENSGENLVGTFTDVGIRSQRVEDYFGLKMLKERCDRGEVDEVYAVTPSSISGSVQETLRYILDLKSLGVPVHFSNGSFNLDLVQSDALKMLLEAFESEEIHTEE